MDMFPSVMFVNLYFIGKRIVQTKKYIFLYLQMKFENVILKIS